MKPRKPPVLIKAIVACTLPFFFLSMCGIMFIGVGLIAALLDTLLFLYLLVTWTSPFEVLPHGEAVMAIIGVCIYPLGAVHMFLADRFGLECGYPIED